MFKTDATVRFGQILSAIELLGMGNFNEYLLFTAVLLLLSTVYCTLMITVQYRRLYNTKKLSSLSYITGRTVLPGTVSRSVRSRKAGRQGGSDG